MMVQTTIFDAPLAHREGERGMRVARDALTLWRERADEWVASLYPGTVFTADDLVAAVGLPSSVDGRPSNNGVGAYIRGLRARKRIVPDGYDTSSRVSNHGRVLRLWRVVAVKTEAAA